MPPDVAGCEYPPDKRRLRPRVSVLPLRAGTLIPGSFADSILPAGFRAGGDAPLNYGVGSPGTITQYAAFSDGWTIIVFADAYPWAATSVAQEIARALGKALPGGTRSLRRPGG